jgi:hypothetical protein
MIKNVDVDVDIVIDVYDVIEYIEDYADGYDIKRIEKSLDVVTSMPNDGLIDGMKNEVLKKASEKYTLEQLEELLNIKY